MNERYKFEEDAEGELRSLDMSVTINCEGRPVVLQEYSVKVEITGVDSLGEAFREEIIDIIIHTDGAFGVVDGEEWFKKVCFSGDKPEVTFRVRANSVGTGTVSIDAYHQRRYLGTVRFPLEVRDRDKCGF